MHFLHELQVWRVFCRDGGLSCLSGPPCRYPSAGGRRGSTFIRANERRREGEREDCVGKKREFPGISMEFLDPRCSVCVCVRERVRGWRGSSSLQKSRSIETHMVRNRSWGDLFPICSRRSPYLGFAAVLITPSTRGRCLARSTPRSQSR